VSSAGFDVRWVCLVHWAVVCIGGPIFGAALFGCNRWVAGTGMQCNAAPCCYLSWCGSRAGPGALGVLGVLGAWIGVRLFGAFRALSVKFRLTWISC
jgi:hypothetical protein